MRQSIKTYLKVFLNLATALLILLFCIFILPKCIWFFMPFIIGWIISSIASPVVRFFEEKLKVSGDCGRAGGGGLAGLPAGG